MICSQCHASAALLPSLIGLLLPEAVKLGSMQGLCHLISDHLICQTVSDVNVAFGHLICNVEVSDVEVTRVLASTLVSIGLEHHGAFVVLIEDILFYWISLHLKKLLCPYHWRDNFVSGYHFCFGRTSCVHTCFLLREVMAPSPIMKVDPV